MRLIPYMFLMYIFNYLDRTNVGFAALKMQKDLGMSDKVFGVGAGIFFIGYFLFEVPSNLIMERVGARKWMARIMVTWGIISCSMMFAQNATQFYILRFLLGVAEAGFFPGMILYLTYWFPAAERARAISRFMTATPLAGVLGGPISGYLLDGMHNMGGLKGWQWLFLLEGLPSFFLGFVTYFYLTDRPEQARWLTDPEKEVLLRRLQAENHRRRQKQHMPLLTALRHPQVILLSALYLAMQIGFYGYNFWLPKLLKGFGLSTLNIGFVSAIPYALAAIAMVVAGLLSDRSGERKRYVSIACIVAAMGMVATGLAINMGPAGAVPGIAALCLTAIGLWSTLGPFWTLPTSFLSGAAAAGGIAFINSVGNLGGQIGPAIMGFAKDWTKNDKAGLYALAISLVVAATLAAIIHHDRTLERPHDAES
jgi:ACS family tartrate transporter-like MFS transporter